MSDAGVIAPLDAARDEGRELLLEPEGLALVESLGFEVPEHRLLTAAEELEGLDLASFPGERVVLKAVVPGLAHKTEVGGVLVVPKQARAVAEAADTLWRRFAGSDCRGLLLAEYVDHEDAIRGELLLSVRWTDDFGPVVTLGPGGVQAEVLSRGLDGGRAAAILSSAVADSGRLREALSSKLFVSWVCEPQRGREPVAQIGQLVHMIQGLIRDAEAAMPGELRELEINPLVFRDGWAVALDVFARLGGSVDPPDPERPIAKLERLLTPRSLAIQGVSASMNPGRIVLDNVLASGFDPKNIYLVKPGCETLAGCRCVADVASLPETVDLAVLGVAAAELPGVVQSFIDERKAESLILISGGVGESPGSKWTSLALEQMIRESRSTDWGGPIVNGGNCLGVRSVPGRFDTMFIPRHKLSYPSGEAAELALISQSGALAVARASCLAELNPRYVVSIGNQIDLTVGDYLTYLERDDSVRVFACYVEGFKPGDGRRWLESVVRIADSGRTVVLYRAGRTAAGSQAAASHTASIAGDYAVTRELARAAGALVADTLEDFEDLSRLALALDGRPLSGRRLGALSNAGFECVAIADGVGSLELADFEWSTRGELDALFATHRLSSVVKARNPLDVTPILGDEAFAQAAELVLSDPEVDLGLVGCVPLTGALQTLERSTSHAEDVEDESSVARRLVSLWRETRKPWVAVVDGGAAYDGMARVLTRGGVPVFRSVDRALRLLSIYAEWRSRVAHD